MTNSKKLPKIHSEANNRAKEEVMIINMPKTVIVGGSVITDIPGASTLHTINDISTPFGDASSPIKIMSLDGHTFAFMQRHGGGHVLYPHQIPEKANFLKFMELGFVYVIQFTAIGSVEDIEPGTIVIFKQVYNMTHGRPNKLLEGVVAHISHNDPFCPRLSEAVIKAMKKTGIPFMPINACACINGPEFGNKVDNTMMRKQEIAAVGMTQYPASILARWASMCQIMIGMITDQDCAKGDETASAKHVVDNMKKFKNRQIEVLKKLLPLIPKNTDCPHCIQTPDIIVTDRNNWPKEELSTIQLMFKRFREQRRK